MLSFVKTAVNAGIYKEIIVVADNTDVELQ